MKKAPKKLIYVYTLLSWTLTVLALVFRVLARLYSYDSEIGYFESGALFPTLHYICLALIALLAGSALILFRRFPVPDAVLFGMRSTCVMEKIAAAVGGISMLIVSVYTALFYYSAGILTPTGFTLVGLLTASFSVFFFLFFWVPSAVGKNLHVFSGFALVLHFAYILVTTYFELYTPMNNPVKILLQLTAIAAILYLLSDLRFYLGIARPVRYIASATIFLALTAVSVFSIGMFEVMTEAHTQLYYLYSLTCFALLVPAVVRIIRMLMLWVQADRTEDNVEAPISDASSLPSEADIASEEQHDGDSIELPTPDDKLENIDTRQDSDE